MVQCSTLTSDDMQWLTVILTMLVYLLLVPFHRWSVYMGLCVFLLVSFQSSSLYMEASFFLRYVIPNYSLLVWSGAFYSLRFCFFNVCSFCYSFLLEHITHAKGLHYGITKHGYNILWSNSSITITVFYPLFLFPFFFSVFSGFHYAIFFCVCVCVVPGFELWASHLLRHSASCFHTQHILCLHSFPITLSPSCLLRAPVSSLFPWRWPF
jgi:hypothetical protein